jgi:hypothetical protein
VEHEIVAVLCLGKEQPMLAAVVLAFVFGEERGEVGQPLYPPPSAPVKQRENRKRGVAAQELTVVT